MSQPKPNNPHVDHTSYELENIFRHMGSNIFSSLLYKWIKQIKAWLYKLLMDDFVYYSFKSMIVYYSLRLHTNDCVLLTLVLNCLQTIAYCLLKFKLFKDDCSSHTQVQDTDIIWLCIAH